MTKMEPTNKQARRVLTEEEWQDTNRLKKIWEAKAKPLGLTQAKASKEFGFANQSAVSQYLNGHIPLNMKMAAKFAKLLEVDPMLICPNMNWTHNGSKATVISVTDCAKLEFTVAVNDSLAPIVMKGDMMVVDSSDPSHDGIPTPMGKIIAIFRSKEDEKTLPLQLINEKNSYISPKKQEKVKTSTPIEEPVEPKFIGKENVNEILDVAKAAEYLGVSTETIRILARKKKIPCAKIGRQWKFYKKDLKSFIQDQYKTQ